MKIITQACSMLALAALLMACGQKGPLYLPQPAKPAPNAPKTAPAAQPIGSGK